MNTYIVRVRLPNGSWTDVHMHADNQGQVKQLAEGMYGHGNVIAVVGEAR
jgi:hypothetical protein